MEVIEVTEREVEIIEVIERGPQGPTGAAGTGIETLTTAGDLLYRDNSAAARLPIGSSSQILKVVNGLPAWANESGAVTSVNGQTGAVTVAAEQHASEHESGGGDQLNATAALVTTDQSSLNGIYFSDDTSTNGRLNFFRTGTRKNTKLQFNSDTGRWELIQNMSVVGQSEANSASYPWTASPWEDPSTPPIIASITVTRVGLEEMVQKLAETGSAATATTSDDGLMSSSDKTKLNGIAVGAEVNVNADWSATSGDAQILNKPSTFTPTAHAAAHASSGSDPLAPSDIGAQSLFTAVNVTSGVQTSPHQLSALRAQAVRVATTINFTIRLPETGHQSGDIVEIRAATLSSGAIITIERGAGPSSWTTIATISSQGGKLRFVADGTGRSNWEEDTYFTTNGTIGAPDSHAHDASDITSGSFGNISFDGKLGTTAGLPVVTTTAGAVTTLALGTANQVLKVNSGATGVEFGTVDSVDDYTVITTGQTATNGARIAADTTASAFTLTLPATPSNGDTVYILDYAGTFDTNNLTLGRNGSNIEGLAEDMTCNVEGSSFKMVYTGATNGWQMIPYYGTGVNVGTSAADVLSVSSGELVADDAGADRIVFWDDSESKLRYLEAGSGLSISGTTLTTTASGGSKTYAVFTAEHNQPPSTAFATLDTRNSIAVLDFDAATDESAVFVGIMPEAASLGSGLIVRLHWMATSATSGNVRWGVQFERSNTDLDADSFDTAVEATAATNGTSGIITTTAITVTTIDGITAGDVFRLKVFRNADDATNDTMTGDAELVAVEVRSAA